MRTLLPTVPINHSKCLLTLGNSLSFGAQRYSKMLHLQVFLMQHMVGGCWKLSCAFCFIGLQLWLGTPWLRYPKDPPQRTALLGHGNKDRIKSQPKFFQVELVLPWGGAGSIPLWYPTLPSQALLPRLPGHSSSCTHPHPNTSTSSLVWERLHIPETWRWSQRLGLSAAGETKKPQLAQLFKRSCNMLLLWVIAGFFLYWYYHYYPLQP